MNQAKVLGAKVLAEDAGVLTGNELIKMAKAFDNRDGLSSKQKWVAEFTDAFPWNVLKVFGSVLFVLVFVYAVLYVSFLLATPGIDIERKEQLEKLAQAEIDGNAGAKAEAQLELRRLDAKESLPDATISSVMTVISLVAAIGGIFSLPLLTSATINFTVARVFAARKFVLEQRGKADSVQADPGTPQPGAPTRK